MNKYEIEHRSFEHEMQGDGAWGIASEIGMLTGLECDDIWEHIGGKSSFSGQWFVKTFRALGFNCNSTWIKFDKSTPYPCMIRCRIPRVKNQWAGWVYYDGYVYDVVHGKMTWAKWNEWWPNYRVTSMLQVWLETEQKINEFTDH